jgi:hypothetical protein
MKVAEYENHYCPYFRCEECEYVNSAGCCTYDVHAGSICDRERIFKEGFEVGVKAMIDVNTEANESS